MNQIPTYEITLLILCICIVINCKIGPITSDSRPMLTEAKIQNGRFHIFIATLYEALLTLLFYESALAPIGFWTIVLHSIQLVIANYKKKRGERCV